jgi:hypothetical protein
MQARGIGCSGPAGPHVRKRSYQLTPPHKLYINPARVVSGAIMAASASSSSMHVFADTEGRPHVRVVVRFRHGIMRTVVNGESGVVATPTSALDDTHLALRRCSHWQWQSRSCTATAACAGIDCHRGVSGVAFGPGHRPMGHRRISGHRKFNNDDQNIIHHQHPQRHHHHHTGSGMRRGRTMSRP